VSAEIAITAFITLSTVLVFLLPRLYGKFSDNKIVDILIERCCYVIGFYLMVMNSAIIAEVATTAGYTLDIIFRYMWLFGMAGYLLMIVTALKTLFDITRLYKTLVKQRRGFE